MFFGLLDELWDIRREVYKTYAFKHYSWRDLFLIECEIEERLPARIKKNLPPNDITKSELWAVYLNAAKELTAETIEEEVVHVSPHYYNKTVSTDTDSD